MAKAPAHSTYARIVGEVAIAWNGLERRLDSLIYHYLTVDAHVAGFILGEMRNVTKGEFAAFLIERFEDQALLKDHALHFVAMVNRLRENRNILEHARPLSFSERYHGTIYKMSKRGFDLEFDAPIEQLKSLLKSMQDTAPYARWITFCLSMYEQNEADGFKGGPTTAEAALEVLASIDRPQLPKVMKPLP